MKPDTPEISNKPSPMAAGLACARWHELVEAKTTVLFSDGFLGCQILVRSDLLGELMLLDAPGISRCLSGCLGTLANRLLQVV